MLKRNCMPMLIACALLLLSADYVFAAGDGTRNNSGKSTTMWVGTGAGQCKILHIKSGQIIAARFLYFYVWRKK